MRYVYHMVFQCHEKTHRTQVTLNRPIESGIDLRDIEAEFSKLYAKGKTALCDTWKLFRIEEKKFSYYMVFAIADGPTHTRIKTVTLKKKITSEEIFHQATHWGEGYICVACIPVATPEEESTDPFIISL